MQGADSRDREQRGPEVQAKNIWEAGREEFCPTSGWPGCRALRAADEDLHERQGVEGLGEHDLGGEAKGPRAARDGPRKQRARARRVPLPSARLSRRAEAAKREHGPEYEGEHHDRLRHDLGPGAGKGQGHEQRRAAAERVGPGRAKQNRATSGAQAAACR